MRVCVHLHLPNLGSYVWRFTILFYNELVHMKKVQSTLVKNTLLTTLPFAWPLFATWVFKHQLIVVLLKILTCITHDLKLFSLEMFSM